jgi:hypothetical protein
VDEEANFDEDDYFEHDYSGSGPYSAYVTGDIDQISYVQFYYGDGGVRKISIASLTNLSIFSMGFTGVSPASIDFSQNKNLAFLECSACRITSLDISKNTKLELLKIGNNMGLSTAAVDKVINDLYTNAIANSRYGVLLNFEVGLNDPDAFIGPPSAASMDKLRELRSVYGWGIIPENF